jgi:uncharacterized protein (DUF2141 family)
MMNYLGGLSHLAALAVCLVIGICAGCGGGAERPAEKTPETGAVRVTFTGLRNAEGQLLVNLFDGAEGFPDESSRALRTKRVPADREPLEVSFDGLPHGAYAVSVVHDENANDRLDRGRLGIPKEGYGASRNPPTRFGPPEYSDAAFELKESERTVEIELRYLL